MTEPEAIQFLKARGYVVFKPPDESLEKRRRKIRHAEMYDGHWKRTCELCGKEFLVLRPGDNLRDYCCTLHKHQATYQRRKARQKGE